MERRLAAILSADVVGYSRLMAADEEGTLAQLKAHRKELIKPKTAEHQGRVVKLMGDGTLMEFASVVDALNFAIDVQRAMAERNVAVPDDRRVIYRVGINIGDIIVDGDDIYGDGVNVAARLQEIADPGGICISAKVHEEVRNKLSIVFEDLGEQAVKNIPEPVRVFRVPLRTVSADMVVTDRKGTSPASWKRSALMTATATLVVVVGIALWIRPWAPTVETASVERMAFPLPDRPSIAVLPFTNMSGDPEQEYFVDGMTEDLITDLSKVSGLFVIARNSTFSYKGRQVKVRQVAEELGVRYILEGSVRRLGDQVRINAQLIDATTGGHLWAERYDGTLENVFALQDQVTQQIVVALAVSLTDQDQTQVGQNETNNPEAYDAFLQGWNYYRRGTPDDFAKAIPYFKQAVQLDPNYGRAYSALAAVYWYSMWSGWTWSLALGMDQASVFYEKYLRAAKKDPSALTYQVASEHAAARRRKPDRALSEAERAIALDANSPAGYLAMANALLKAGRPAEALENVRTAMRLDPHYPASYLTRLAQAQFALGRYQDAAATLEQAAKRNPEDDWTYVYLAAAYGHLGREEDAMAAVRKADALRAKLGWGPLTLQTLRQSRFFRWTGDMTSLREGLVNAGVSVGRADWVALVSTVTTGFEVEGATTIDVVTAKAMHDRGVPFVDVDQRWMQGHIPGAYYLRMGYGEFSEVRFSTIIRKDQEFVVYGFGGTRRTAASASARVVTWGFEKVYFFREGIEGWISAGFPVEGWKAE